MAGAPGDPAPIARIAHVAPPSADPVAPGGQETAVPLLERPRRVLFQGLRLVTFECTPRNFGAAGTVAWQLAHESGGVEITLRDGEAVDMTAGETRRIAFVAFRGEFPATYRFSAHPAAALPAEGGVQVLEDGPPGDCPSCFRDATNDFFHMDPSISPDSRDLDIFSGGSVIADIATLREAFAADGPLACGHKGFAGEHAVVICEDGSGELPEGPAVLVWMLAGQRFGRDSQVYPYRSGVFNLEVVLPASMWTSTPRRISGRPWSVCATCTRGSTSGTSPS